MKKFCCSIFVFLYVFCAYAQFSAFEKSNKYICSPEIAVGCRGQFPIRKDGNKAFLLKDGPNAFAYRVKVLREAKRSIRIQTFIWKNDHAGRLLAQILKEKRAEGVDVRLILDGWANFSKQTRTLYKEMRDAGIEVVGFETRTAYIMNELFGSAPGGLMHRYHEKVMVIDAEEENATAIVGGYNVANEYFRIATEAKDRWTDMDVVFQGPAVQDALHMFERNRYYHQYLANSNHSYKSKSGLNIWDMTFEEDGVVPSPLAESPVPLNDSGVLAGLAQSMATLNPTFKVHEDIELRLYGTRPRIQENYIEQLYVEMINDSKEEILIANAYFIPSEKIRVALRNAVKRGVKVHILSNGATGSNHGVVVVVAHYYYHELLSVNNDPLAIWNGGQFRIYEWLGTAVGEGTLHSKWAVFDRKASIIGSYNLNPRSDWFDTEDVMAIKGRSIALELAKFFHEEHLVFDSEKSKFKLVTEVTPRQAESYFNNTVWESIKLQLIRVFEKML